MTGTGLAIAVAGVGAIVSLLVGVFAQPLGRALSLMDYPDTAGGRKLHRFVTPLVGGIGVVWACMASVAALLLLEAPPASKEVLTWFSITTCGMFLVGAADDRFGLTAPFRLTIAAALLLLAIAQVPDFQLSFLLFAGQERLVLLPGLLGVGFTLLCLVGLLNAVNMADGKNGLVIGQALIWSAVLIVRLPEPMRPLMLGIMASLTVLLVFNMQGKLFLGDSGSYGLSSMFGLLAIYAWNQGFADMHADDLALIFAIPVFDTLRLIVHRVAIGKTPFTAGRDHLHHYLYAHWGWPKPLPWVLALVAVPNIGALLLPGTGLIWLGVSLAGYFALLWTAVRPATAIAAE